MLLALSWLIIDQKMSVGDVHSCFASTSANGGFHYEFWVVLLVGCD